MSRKAASPTPLMSVPALVDPLRIYHIHTGYVELSLQLRSLDSSRNLSFESDKGTAVYMPHQALVGAGPPLAVLKVQMERGMQVGDQGSIAWDGGNVDSSSSFVKLLLPRLEPEFSCHTWSRVCKFSCRYWLILLHYLLPHCRRHHNDLVSTEELCDDPAGGPGGRCRRFGMPESRTHYFS